MPLGMEQKKTECEWVRDQLSAYIDGHVTPEEQKRIEGHLRECQPCSAELADLRLAVNLLHEVPMVAVPRPFTITAPAAARKPGFSRAFFILRNATAVTAALLIMLVTVTYVLPQTTSNVTTYAPLSSEKSQSTTAPIALAKRVELQPGNQNDTITTQQGQNSPNMAPAATEPARAVVPITAQTSSLTSSGASSGSGVSTQDSSNGQTDTAVGEVGASGISSGSDGQSDVSSPPSPEPVFAHDARDSNVGSNQLLDIATIVMIWLALTLGTTTTTIWLRERNRQ